MFSEQLLEAAWEGRLEEVEELLIVGHDQGQAKDPKAVGRVWDALVRRPAPVDPRLGEMLWQRLTAPTLPAGTLPTVVTDHPELWPSLTVLGGWAKVTELRLAVRWALDDPSRAGAVRALLPHLNRVPHRKEILWQALEPHQAPGTLLAVLAALPEAERHIEAAGRRCRREGEFQRWDRLACIAPPRLRQQWLDAQGMALPMALDLMRSEQRTQQLAALGRQARPGRRLRG